MAKIRKWKPSIFFVVMVVLELVVVAWSYEGSKALYGSRLNNEYIQLQRAWRLRGRRGRGHHHHNRGNNRGRNRFTEWERVDSRGGKFRQNKRTSLMMTTTPRDKELFVTVESVESCCPTIFEIVEPAAGRNRSGHLVELFRDENVRQRFYEVSCRPGVVDKPCRFLENRHSRVSTCTQQFSFTYALVRPPGSSSVTEGGGEEQHPWSLDYISIRSGCSCQVIATKRRKKQRGEF